MSSTAVQTSKVEDLVKRGWQRRLLVLVVDEAAIVLALVAAGVSLLIVLGTQILSAGWLAVFGIAGIGLAMRGVRRRMVDRYRVAQIIDERLSLHDFLSTAWFLKTQAPQVDEKAAGIQLLRAEELARGADPAAAFPFERQKRWVITAALCLLVLGLFSARYLVTKELSLRRAFLPATLAGVFENLAHRNERGNHDRQKEAESKGLPPGAMTPAQGPSQDQQAEQGRKSADSNADGQADPKSESADASSGEPQSKDGKSGGEKGGKPSGQSQNAQANKQAADGNQQDAQNASGGNKSESLIDKMRDALSSVMAKVKPSGGSQASQSPSQRGADGQKSAEQSGMKDQSGDGQNNSGNQQTAQEQADGQQQGQGTAKSQQSQGRDSAQASDKKGSDAQSGVGHSDGDKELKAAEQAKAMGKLAEIIGKRSANLTGEMEIEPSGKQQLQTQYTHKQGQHADLGGEINRDEIPVEDQEYVREYMELVRKKPAAGAAAGH